MRKQLLEMITMFVILTVVTVSQGKTIHIKYVQLCVNYTSTDLFLKDIKYKIMAKIISLHIT